MAEDDELSWAEQGEWVRRISSQCLKLLSDRVGNGQLNDDDLEQLSKLSTIARTWRAQELKPGDGEGGEATKEDDVSLMRKAALK